MTDKAAAVSTKAGGSPTDRPSALTAAIPIFVLIIVTGLAYANAWSNALTYDDKLFVDPERFADLAAIPGYFSKNVWAAKDTTGGLYRPLLFVSMALDANLFGDWVAGYHLVNIALHVLVTLLVYSFVARLLEMDNKTAVSSAYIAFLAAVVYGVYPLHTEVVNSLFNRSILLAAISSLAGLWWLLRFLESSPVLAWTGLFLAYLFALFCREAAIVLPGLAVVLVLVYSEENFPQRIHKCLPVFYLLIPMVFYLVMRDRTLSVGVSGLAQTATGLSGVVAQVDPSRLLDDQMILAAAGTWLQALGVIFWPFEPKLSYAKVPHYLQLAGIFIHLVLLVLALFQFRQGRKGLLICLAFFYIALLPSSRLFGGGSVVPHLTERYLYISLVGFTILLAYGLRYLNLRFDRLLSAAPVVLALFLLIPATWARNALWSDELALFENDYNRGARDGYILRLLTAAHLRNNDFDRVIEICEANPSELQAFGKFATHCASAFSYSGRLEDAVQAYLLGTQHRSSRRLAHSNLAQHYMRQGRWDDAKIQFEKAVEAEQDPAKKEHFTGLMLVHLYPGDRERLLEARSHFEEALRLRPGLSVSQEWLNRLNEFLGPVPENQ